MGRLIYLPRVFNDTQIKIKDFVKMKISPWFENDSFTEKKLKNRYFHKIFTEQCELRRARNGCTLILLILQYSVVIRPKWNLRLLSYWTEKLQFLKSLKVMSIKQYSHFWSDGTEEKKSSFHHFKFVMIMQEISSKQINKKAVIIFTTDVECCKVQTCFE